RRGLRQQPETSTSATPSAPGTHSWSRSSTTCTPHAPHWTGCRTPSSRDWVSARPGWPRSRSVARVLICPGPTSSPAEEVAELAPADVVAVAVAVDHPLTEEGDDLVDEVDPGACRGGREGPGDYCGGQDLPVAGQRLGGHEPAFGFPLPRERPIALAGRCQRRPSKPQRSGGRCRHRG